MYAFGSMTERSKDNIYGYMWEESIQKKIRPLSKLGTKQSDGYTHISNYRLRMLLKMENQQKQSLFVRT